MLALTATAAPPVRDEIVTRLGLRDPELLIRGFDRPNLRFSVERFHGEQGAERKRRALLELIERSTPPGIVYVSTRRESEELAEELCSGALRAASYHAGMKSSERDDVQERFMDGELDVVVATTAFGMGIDKADVRWVFHAEVAESLDAYYQEAGRAGRDGAPAEIVLFYRSEDVGLRRFFAGGHVEVDELAHVLDAVRRGVPATDLRAEVDLSDTKLASALSRLEDAGAVRVAMDGEVAPVTDAPSAELVTAAAEAEEMRRSFDRSRVDMMRAYAETDDCRRAFILSYFGEPFEPPCGFCDNCEAGRVNAPPVGCAVPGRRAGRPRLVGRGRRPALRRRLDGRPVRRGGLQDARPGSRARARAADRRVGRRRRARPRCAPPSLSSGPRSSASGRPRAARAPRPGCRRPDGVDRLVGQVGRVLLDLLGGLLGVLRAGAHLVRGLLRVLLDLGGVVLDLLGLVLVDAAAAAGHAASETATIEAGEDACVSVGSWHFASGSTRTSVVRLVGPPRELSTRNTPVQGVENAASGLWRIPEGWRLARQTSRATSGPPRVNILRDDRVARLRRRGTSS